MTQLLRRTTPLTVGQIVAARMQAGERATERDIAEEVERARAEGRPFEPELADARIRARRLREALRAVPGMDIAYIAREYESARAS
jgi:hypothetical protein